MSHYDEQHEKHTTGFELKNKFVPLVPTEITKKPLYDNVDFPKHYNIHPSGVECIQVTEHMNFCLGNAVKYLWRAGIKSENKLEDLKKAVYYINREIKRIENDK